MSLKQIFNRRMLSLMLLGFSSGLPLLMIGGTLQAWMTDAKVDLTIIGIFSLVGLPYTVKFLWAPFIDRYTLFLGRRRGWILTTQILLALSISCLALAQPAQAPAYVALCAFMIAFFSASQDIVIDAYRREILTNEEQGLGSSFFVNGYRIGMLVAGSFALYLADHMAWQNVYFILAAFMSIGIFTTLFIVQEPTINQLLPRNLKEAVVIPFKEYFQRHSALLMLAFILLYKIGDALASSMATPFYLSLEFTKTDIAAIAKTFGMGATIAGGLLGGILMLRLKLMRSLWLFGIFQMITIPAFIFLAYMGHNYFALAVTIFFENFASGMGTTALLAFMASICDKRFSATQMALFSSLIGVPRVLMSSSTGYLAKTLGWQTFFIFCTVIAIPGLLILRKIRVSDQNSEV